MKVSYHGVGEVTATFFADAVQEGEAVTLSDNATVAPCQEGDTPFGVVLAVGRDQTACTVQFCGMVTLSYSGTAPSVGCTTLVADGNGGVKITESGKVYWVISVDSDAKTVVLLL